MSTTHNLDKMVPLLDESGTVIHELAEQLVPKSGVYKWSEDKKENCRRCGGAGGFAGWPGFTCYECGGECQMWYHYRYTGRTQAALDRLMAGRAKRAAKKEAEHQAKLEISRKEVAPLLKRHEALVPRLKEAATAAYKRFQKDGSSSLLSDWLFNASCLPVPGSIGIRDQIESSTEEDTIKWVTEGRISALEKAADKLEAEALLLSTAPKLETGRHEISGVVLTIKTVESPYGLQDKMLVKLDNGNRVYGSVPSSIYPDRGDRVKLTATIDPKEDHFGFYSRPTKAICLPEID